jgi:hypothetical protein
MIGEITNISKEIKDQGYKCVRINNYKLEVYPEFFIPRCFENADRLNSIIVEYDECFFTYITDKKEKKEAVNVEYGKNYSIAAIGEIRIDSEESPAFILLRLCFMKK